MGKKIKLQAPTLQRIRYMSCFDLPHAPVATAARAAATGRVSMSTRPDPEGSGTVEIATRRCPRLRLAAVYRLSEASNAERSLANGPSRAGEGGRAGCAAGGNNFFLAFSRHFLSRPGSLLPVLSQFPTLAKLLKHVHIFVNTRSLRLYYIGVVGRTCVVQQAGCWFRFPPRPCDPPNTSRRFALVASNACLVGENPT